MRVHLIKERTLLAYARYNPQCFVSLREWISRIREADWKLPEDILHDFGTADLLGRGSSRIVFNISGNRYRLICKMFLLKVKFVFTYFGLAPTLNTLRYVRITGNTHYQIIENGTVEI